MVEVEVEIKNIETSPDGQMITLTVDATVGGITEEIRFGEMVGNLAGLTEPEVRERLKGILGSVVRQRLGMRDELTPEKIWKRTQTYVGATFTIEV